MTLHLLIAVVLLLLQAPAEPAAEQPDNRCPTCDGTGIVRHPDTGANVDCPHCDGTGQSGGDQVGRIFDGQRLEHWRNNREHRQDRRKKLIDRAADGIGTLFGLPALPGKLLQFAGLACGGCCCFVVVSAVGIVGLWAVAKMRRQVP